MIGQASQLLLQSAIGTVQQQRAQEAQARQQQQLAAQGQVTGTTSKPAKPKISKPAKPAAPKAAKPAGSAASGITPVATADDLLGAADQQASSQQQLGDIANQYTTTAANAFRAGQDAIDSTRNNVAAANASAASRGVYDSGIRQGTVGAAQAQGFRDYSNAGGDLALAGDQAIAGRNRVSAANTAYMQALAAKMAQNGAALPVTPGAQNVKGATTLRKPTGSAGKGQ